LSQIIAFLFATAGYYTLDTGIDTAVDYTFMLIRGSGTKTLAQIFYVFETNGLQFTSSISVSPSGAMVLTINVPNAGELYIKKPCVATVWYTKDRGLIMKYTPRKPERLAERREMERAVVKEIEETAGQTANVCPECGFSSCEVH
jgi:hypothetical protein